MKEMKQSSVAVLIGIVILLLGIEILLIYIACTTQTSDDFTFEDRDVNKNTTSTTSTSTTSTSTTRTSTTIVTSSISSENSTEKNTTLETIHTTALTNMTTTETSAATRTTASTTTSQSSTLSSSLSSPPLPLPSSPSLPLPSSPSLPLPSSPSSPTPSSWETIRPPCICITHSLSSKTSHSITTSAIKTRTNTTKTTIRMTAFKKQNFASMFSLPTTNKTTSTSTETNATEISSMFPFITLTSTTASLPTPSSTTVSPLLIMAATTKENKPYSKIIIPKFNYVLRNEKGVACVLANMTINLQHTKDSQIQKFTVPTDAKPTGICAERTINMTLSWEKSAKNQVNRNKITFNYAHDNSKFFLDSIFVDVHLRDSIEMTRYTKRHLQLFSAAIKDGIFTCKVNIRINVENRMNVDISNIYLIAFNKCSSNCTKTETNCILETVKIVKTIAIVGIIIVSIVLILILFVLYLLYIQEEPILEDSKTS